MSIHAIRTVRVTAGRALALLALTASLLTIGLLSVSAQSSGEDDVPTPVLISEPVEESLTKLTIEGSAARSVSYDGTIGRFTVSVLGSTVLEAVSEGNTAVNAIADAVAENCTVDEPETADHTADPTCISPEGLRTTRIRIYEEYDWTERGRVSQGFRYENGLSIEIRGTGFAGGLVDLVIRAGGNHVRFDGLDFTTSRRAETERLTQLDAIDDALAQADSIASHMGYEVVRIVEVNPLGSFTPGEVLRAEVEEAAADSSVPTQVFAGGESISARVQIVFELRELPPAPPEEPEAE